MTNINLTLATTLDGSETHMLAILVDSWGDKLVIPLTCDTAMGTGVDHIIPADYFTPCAHCGNAVLECNFEAGSDCCDRCTAGKTSDFVPTTMYQDLNGKQVRISEDRTEDIIRMMDECVHTHIHTCQPGVCGISDICTKRDELIGAIPQLAEVKNLKEVKMETLQTAGSHPGMTTVKSSVTVIVNPELDFEERMLIALEAAEFAFWDVIARSYPEAVSGDYLMEDISVTCRPNVQHWLDNNLPTVEKTEPCYRGDKLDLAELHLNYEDTWHLMHTGGGCMCAITDNVAVAGKYYYLVVSGECVCIYEDTFDQEAFMMEHVTAWSFGDNPCVLMNQIDDFMGGNALWDTGKLFDDIQVLAKCDKVT